MKILGIQGSPRRGANSTALLEQLLAGANAAGAATQTLIPWHYSIAPCLACDGCARNGRCTQKDDFQEIHERILDSDALVLATPVYFGAVSAQAKALIDRCQIFWNTSHVLNKPMPPGPAGTMRRGVLIATAGQDRALMFQGPRITFDFWMRSLSGEIYAELLYGGLDERNAIHQNSTAMERACRIGRRLAQGLPAEGSES